MVFTNAIRIQYTQYLPIKPFISSAFISKMVDITVGREWGGKGVRLWHGAFRLLYCLT